jgi:glycosyltransferase involved in cell wall biosynthesis
MISVALCTYNGEKFLSEQLQSIASQTLQPGEIVLCDDKSTDNTIEIARSFSLKSGIPVHLFRNEERLGVTNNFRKAISLCKGEFIALSDQDDVWMPNKLELSVGHLNQPGNRHINVVFTDLLLVDDELNSLGRTMWQQLNFSKKQQEEWLNGRGMDIILRKGNVVTGASVVFRSSFRSKLEIPLSKELKIWLHDGIIALAALRDNCIACIDKPTVLYRQHSTQSVGLKTPDKKLSFFKRFSNAIKGSSGVENEINAELSIATRLRDDLLQMGFTNKQLKVLNGKIGYFSARRNMPASRIQRIPLILRQLFSFNYYRYSRSFFLNVLKDFFRPAH